MRRLPNITKPIGVPFEHKGKTLVAVERPKGIEPIDACKGCIFVASCYTQLACSSFDREDKKNIWFREYTQSN